MRFPHVAEVTPEFNAGSARDTPPGTLQGSFGAIFFARSIFDFSQ
jgi:hypothetical protein